MQKRFLILPVLLLLFVMIVAACAVPAPTDQASINRAVQATLTAVVVADGSAPATTPAPEDAQVEAPATPEAPAAVPQMVLPPSVPDFDPIPRPAKTLGDPNAPVVMYEWSDYT